MKLTDLPLSHQLQIIARIDAESKLQLARVSRHFQDMIIGSQAPVSWSEVEVRVTSGERTLPFLAKVSPYARAMVAYVGSDVFGREGSLPEFPALTHLDIRAMTPATRPSLDGLLTPAVLSAFPSLRNLRLDGKMTENILRDLPSMLPAGLTSLTLGIPWQSSIAQGVRTLEVDVRRGNANFTPTVSPLSFSSLSTLELRCHSVNAFISMSNLLAAMRGLDTLETLIFHGRCLGAPGGPASFLDDPNVECLPRRLSTIALCFWYGGDVMDRNVARAIVRRASTLKTVAIHSDMSLNLVGFVDLITGLCHERSQIELLSVLAYNVGVISQDEVRRLCSHLMAHAQELPHLKLFHFETGGRPQLVFNQEGCSVAALKQRLPRPECVVKFDDSSPGYTPEFSDAEKAFMRGLDGYTKTGPPWIGRL